MGNVPLCKIGTGWVFNINTGVGYRVRRESRTGAIQAFEKAFSINNGTVDYNLEVPSGVVRKALHLLDLSKAGRLDGLMKQLEGEQK